MYANFVKKITFSADEHLIEQARNKARAQHTTLNAAFREWLLRFAARPGDGTEHDALMKRLSYVKAGRHFSRDEMNERKVLPLRYPIQQVEKLRKRDRCRLSPADHCVTTRPERRYREGHCDAVIAA